MNPRLRLYEFLATPAHAYLWLVAQFLGVNFSFRIADTDDPDEPFLVRLTPDLLNHIKKCFEHESGGDMICPRCNRKYRDHEIGGDDPCVS